MITRGQRRPAYTYASNTYSRGSLGTKERCLLDKEPSNQVPTIQADDAPPFLKDTPSPKSKNAFLLTPLRLKYFPKLSPTILRSLLRSPSPRLPTPDDSFSESTVSSKLEPAFTCPVDSNPPFPPTPPMTDKLTCRSTFQSPVQRKLFDGLESPSIHDSLDELDLDTSSLLSSTLPRLPQPDDAVPIQPPFDLAFSFGLSGSFQITTLSQCVADEIKAAGETPDERRRVLLSKLRSPPYSDSSSSRLVISHPAPCSLGPVIPDPVHSRLPVRNPGVLEIEFAELLERRAAEEIDDASRLRDMAERLERLAQHRRQLSKLVARNMGD
ncbi:hypothetical protein D9758_001248 [Tetrapyrgos nigripes]|uniref:Uncharacterized protein n=1 Tax=Tetrapyrgos nigripes TaxID=182062 RepID=A0A8H5LU30_9AGAR|nr:hypothetical protein D9758_001248 [Tetrapyrgos nigripes]